MGTHIWTFTTLLDPEAIIETKLYLLPGEGCAEVGSSG